MTDNNDDPHGVPLVATTRAGSTGAPGPMPRAGPPSTTGGHPRWVMVKRRKRGSKVTLDQRALERVSTLYCYIVKACP